ncbi:uncharacterized protein METZ01_LOCUS344225 [marine metagenome]|uniref:Uncharacterized protein n=1 Tax=marine metagenome TaxID=408172 RepID=A0A382R466_9ZZZZ
MGWGKIWLYGLWVNYPYYKVDYFLGGGPTNELSYRWFCISIVIETCCIGMQLPPQDPERRSQQIH